MLPECYSYTGRPPSPLSGDPENAANPLHPSQQERAALQGAELYSMGEIWEFLEEALEGRSISFPQLVEALVRGADGAKDPQSYDTRMKMRALGVYFLCADRYHNDENSHDIGVWSQYYYYFARVFHLNAFPASYEAWNPVIVEMLMAIGHADRCTLASFLDNIVRLFFGGTMHQPMLADTLDEEIRFDELGKHIVIQIVTSLPVAELSYRLLIHYIQHQHSGKVFFNIQEIRVLARLLESPTISLMDALYGADAILSAFPKNAFSQEIIEILLTTLLEKVLANTDEPFNKICEAIFALTEDYPAFDKSSFWRKNLPQFEMLFHRLKVIVEPPPRKVGWAYFQELLNKPSADDWNLAMNKIMEFCIFLYQHGSGSPKLQNDLIRFLLNFARKEFDDISPETLMAGLTSLAPLLTPKEGLDGKTRGAILNFCITYLNIYLPAAEEKQLVAQGLKHHFVITPDWADCVLQNIGMIFPSNAPISIQETLNTSLALMGDVASHIPDFQALVWLELSLHFRQFGDPCILLEKAFEVKHTPQKIQLKEAHANMILGVVRGGQLSCTAGLALTKKLLAHCLLEKEWIEALFQSLLLDFSTSRTLLHSDFCDLLELMSPKDHSFDREGLRVILSSSLDLFTTRDFILDNFITVASSSSSFAEIRRYVDRMFGILDDLKAYYDLPQSHLSEEFCVAYLRAVSDEISNLQNTILRMQDIHTRRNLQKKGSKNRGIEMPLGGLFMRNFSRLAFKDYKDTLLCLACYLSEKVSHHRDLRAVANGIVSQFAAMVFIPTDEPEPILVQDETGKWKIVQKEKEHAAPKGRHAST